MNRLIITLLCGFWVFSAYCQDTNPTVGQQQVTAHQDSAAASQSAAITTKKPKAKFFSKANYFVMPGASMGKVPAYSLMVGYAAEWGGYVQYKTNLARKGDFQKGERYSYFYNTDYTKTGVSAYTAGILKQLFMDPDVFLYGGAGYGTKWTHWHTRGGVSTEIKEYSVAGVMMEAGLIYRYKFMVVGAGFSAVIGRFIYPEGNLLLGITF